MERIARMAIEKRAVDDEQQQNGRAVGSRRERIARRGTSVGHRRTHRRGAEDLGGGDRSQARRIGRSGSRRKGGGGCGRWVEEQLRNALRNKRMRRGGRDDESRRIGRDGGYGNLGSRFEGADLGCPGNRRTDRLRKSRRRGRSSPRRSGPLRSRRRRPTGRPLKGSRIGSRRAGRHRRGSRGSGVRRTDRRRRSRSLLRRKSRGRHPS